MKPSRLFCHTWLLAVGVLAGCNTNVPPLVEALPSPIVVQEVATALPTFVGGGSGVIAFCRDPGDWNIDIYALDIASGKLDQLTYDTSWDCDPVWSPDGELIAFVTDGGGGYREIYVMNGDGSEVRRLTHNPLADGNPFWSPDGKWVGYISRRYYLSGVYATHLEDGLEQILVQMQWAYDVAVSPDGEKFLIDTYLGFAGLFVPNGKVAGSAQMVLRISVEGFRFPAWSPDGTKIAFTAGRIMNSDIFVINADGTGLEQLTDSPGEDFDPAWSPDGSLIAFISGRDGQYDIYLMNADGSNQVKLTDDLLPDYSPSWQP
ncbi:MAG: hypothetical protein L0287_12210 [Anaerolineae bacterium]|nr:hypothetical protein [Anaerolineae bacterium]